ncbi:MAG TPA: class I SAM-dependent methyltransferase [Candidatus Acidoferrum sp.]|jgi:SAM-dependent methyltransferase
MERYTLPHRLAGEKDRLALMSALLDPVELSWIARLGIGAGSRCLELGCGNGSISVALAGRVAPSGRVVASDIDLAFVGDLSGPNLEVRRVDVLEDAIEEHAYDFVVARALLHHLPSPVAALQRAVSALKPGGVFLSIEPDMLPCTVTEPQAMHEFWQGWLKWSAEAGIDYFIGRKTQAWAASLGLEQIGSEGFTAHFNGGSDWARYWSETIAELAPALEKSGHVSPALMQEFMASYQDPHYWTSVISFVGTWGRAPR